MDRRAKVELFEEIRRGYAAGETILALAKKYHVHRRMVRRALASAVPPERKRQERILPRLGPVKEFIDSILERDGEAPRKQRHTARRIWTRLCIEHSQHPVAESTVREYTCMDESQFFAGIAERMADQAFQRLAAKLITTNEPLAFSIEKAAERLSLSRSTQKP